MVIIRCSFMAALECANSFFDIVIIRVSFADWDHIRGTYVVCHLTFDAPLHMENSVPCPPCAAAAASSSNVVITNGLFCGRLLEQTYSSVRGLLAALWPSARWCWVACSTCSSRGSTPCGPLVYVHVFINLYLQIVLQAQAYYGRLHSRRA